MKKAVCPVRNSKKIQKQLPKNSKTSNGVYIGRFQPFTKTHRKIVQFIDAEPDVGEIIIIKGSIQWNDQNPDPHSLASRNPFTVEECCEMIKLSLTGRVKKPWRIVLVPDTQTKTTDPLWREWVDLIVRLTPMSSDFVIYTNDPREKRAFEAIGLEARSFPASSLLFRATLAREKIATKKKREWRKYVDPEAADYLEKINGPSRILKLLEKEKKH